jgi:hypothetical protein
LHCEVAFAAIVEGAQAGETEEIADDVFLLPLSLPPPQAVSRIKSKEIPKASGDECLGGLVPSRREPSI